MAVNVDELRARARKKLPRAVFDFIDGAAEDEVTLRRNRTAFERYALIPRVGVDVSNIDLSTTVLGQPVASPLILAPTGLCGMATSRGEIPAGRAAVEAGIVFVASCMSAVTLEEIPAEAPGDHWFQLYIWGDREITRGLVERAQAEGYKALVVTLDTPVLGRRERDIRSGATIPARITVSNALDTLRRPRWLLSVMRGPRVQFANVVAARPDTALSPFALSPLVNSLFDPTVTWEDIDWVRAIWKGPLAVKGVMCAADAQHAVAHGADAVVVSNHGGRQLDSAPASLEALPEVVEAVGSQVEVIFDGGVRRGTDMAKALALGARACMVGRPYLYGLAAGGQAGVASVIEILTSELRRTMALMGCTRLSDLTRECLRPPVG